MNKIYLLFILLLCGNKIFAQQEEKRNCGTVSYMQSIEQDFPNVIAKRAFIEQQTAQYIQNPTKKKRTVITIPVVVHVVYNMNVQNISDAQIASQIDVLNKDFRKTNVDFANTPGIFQPIAADCEIEFVLAKRDPNGDSTNGITRTYTATASFLQNNNVKYAATGGKDAWPATSYLNIWTCKLSGGLLGFAQFPGGPDASDGVVISYKAFGTMGAALAPFNKGRTATHEIGHWLNLFHIWGDDGGSCNGTDLVEDTPNQGAENYGSPVYPHISCNNTPFGDMFMNYMDYSNDASMSMFTAEQKLRMDALFINGGSRFSLLSSQGGIPPYIPQICTVPVNLLASTIDTNSATLSWDSNANAISYVLEYKAILDTNSTIIFPFQNTILLNNLLKNTTYLWRVQTVCNNGSSIFSNYSTFITLDTPVICRKYEPNNSFSETALILSGNTKIKSLIGTPNDVDYFAFNTEGNQNNTRISLTNLPLDYDLYLYNKFGTLISSSQLGRLNDEQIIYNANSPSLYYIKIVGSNGNFTNLACYSLSIESSENAYREENANQIVAQKMIKLYPNPSSAFIATTLHYEGEKEVWCNIYDLYGKKIKSEKIMVQKGANEIKIDIKGFTNGMYLFEILDNEEKRVERFNISK